MGSRPSRCSFLRASLRARRMASPLPDSPLGRLFKVAAELHLAEETFALHLLLQRLEGLIDIVVADENLHAAFLLDSRDQDTDMDGSGADGNCGTNTVGKFNISGTTGWAGQIIN